MANCFKIKGVDAFHYITEDDQAILDMVSTSYHLSFGLSPQIIIDRIKEQTDRFLAASPKAIFTEKESLANSLIDKIERPGKIFFTLSGAESIENALKMARFIKGKNKVLARKNSYHGATLGAISISGDWRNQAISTVDEWTVRIPEPENDPTLSQTRQIILDHGPENIAAICLETITGGNGVIIPSQMWYKGIQDLCDEFNIFLILDEVVCGLYRTGKAFGFHHYPFLKPDFICLAKALSGGMAPLGAVWTTPSIADFFDKHILPAGLTNYGHPLTLAAGIGTQNLINQQEFLPHLNQLISQFTGHLKLLEQLPQVSSIRNIGMIANIALTIDVEWSTFLKHGLYMITAPKNLIVAPALNMPFNDLQRGMKIISDIIQGRKS